MPKNKNWLLANNPALDNSCKCFRNTVPNRKWVVVATFDAEQACRQAVNDCGTLFMKNPLKRMGMGMGMRD